ncbi:MAG: division/cell wall cluster transcriptional repressor MraZ [Oscillospiraceae bacterium]|nr:division/cell wall cluster transcriptional repressor MraZ [Oscillospiraceae bacterium]
MTGEYRHTVDNKGRIFIPARLRETLGDIFYITISADGCLTIYNNENWSKFCSKVDELSYYNQRKMRAFFAYAAKCEMDLQGRVLLPQNLRDYAGIQKDVIIIGCGNHAEIWETGAWERVSSDLLKPENLLSALEELNL